MTATQGRRAALRRLVACLLSAGAAGSITRAYGKPRAACVNLAALSAAQRKRRKLDNYTEKSSDPAETCRGCRFFTAGGAAEACGECQIFNGPANPNGRCDDWTAR